MRFQKVGDALAPDKGCKGPRQYSRARDPDPEAERAMYLTSHFLVAT